MGWTPALSIYSNEDTGQILLAGSVLSALAFLLIINRPAWFGPI